MKKILCVILCFTVLILSGCTANENAKDRDAVTVTASFYPVYIFTLNLLDGIDGIAVECMAQNNTGCLHDYTLTARDVKLLNDSSVLVINGAGMEDLIEDAYKNIDGLAVIDSSEGIDIICNEHDEHDDHNGHGEHGHSHEKNAHIWLSVKNAEKQVENIAEHLIKEFPQYEVPINANKTAYLNRLENLEKETAAFSDEVKGCGVVSFHAAYEYLAIETGFTVCDTIESDEGGEPSAKALAQLSDEIKNGDIKALFTEPDYKGSAAKILSEETGVGVYVLNPITSGEKSLTAYEDIMRENYKTVLKAVK